MNGDGALTRPPYFDAEMWGADTWPLLSAAYSGDLATVTRLLDEEPGRIKAQFAYYEPLHYAVRGGHLEMVRLLLERGGHPKAPGWPDRLGDETPIAKATDRERDDMVALLSRAAESMPPYVWPEERPRSAEEQLKYDFVIACGYKVDRGHVERVLATRPELATIGLYEAVHHGSMEMTRLLIAAGGDVNGHMPSACWFTPLMHCLRYEEPRWELAELLLAQGVPVDSRNGLGMTALHIVVATAGIEAARWLLDHGANVDVIEPEFCSTALGWSARWGRPEMAQLLLERGADRELPRDQAWALPRRWAEKRGHREVAALLG